MREKTLDLIMLALSVGLIFAGGIVYTGSWLLGVIFLVLGLSLQVFREKLQGYIKGIGIDRISVQDEPPRNP
ncbi:MAG: hypothetical protein LPJ95_00390, partial [Paracoccaceae bacterium]|nr:hypothetical protein [Paracoccaceae bacterium]